MQGITTFPSLSDAIRAGFQVFDRTPRGYLVRTKTVSGWALALVDLAQKSSSTPE